MIDHVVFKRNLTILSAWGLGNPLIFNHQDVARWRQVSQLYQNKPMNHLHKGIPNNSQQHRRCQSVHIALPPQTSQKHYSEHYSVGARCLSSVPTDSSGDVKPFTVWLKRCERRARPCTQAHSHLNILRGHEADTLTRSASAVRSKRRAKAIDTSVYGHQAYVHVRAGIEALREPSEMLD